MTTIRAGLTGLILVLTAGWGNATQGDYIKPVAVSQTGDVTAGSPSAIIDGIVPNRGTLVTAPSVVSWNSLATFFTIDFGSVYRVANLSAALDNNDSYQIQYSTDGIAYQNLFTFLASDGPITPAQGGLDLLSTIATYPTAPTDATTFASVGRGFTPVDARYLRIQAIDGDSVYGIGELDAFTANVMVPEPASAALCGVALSLTLLVARVRRGR